MKLIFTFLMLTLSIAVTAQNDSRSVSGSCGTITSRQQQEKIYDFVQHNPAAYYRGTAGIPDSIPLSIHIVGTDAGTGYYSLNNLFLGICQLNERFSPTGFHFYIKWPLHYINNSTYYNHDFNSGDFMMATNNIQNSVNVYFVQDPAGACGYYTYGQDAVAIGKNCANTGSTTLTHELGHYFSLPHTFSGWESGQSWNPEYVTRTGPNANCNRAGDGFCDTYADYLATRWACPGPVGPMDDLGEPYHLDSSMYMSYSMDICQSQFSPQQIAAMQYNLHTERQSFPGSFTPPARALDSVRVAYPKDTLYANLKKAIWKKIPGADYYFVRISLQSAPSIVLQTNLVTDTTLDITAALTNGGRYLVNITPVNANNTCMKFITLQPFAYSTGTGSLSITTTPDAEDGFRVLPNPAKANQTLSVNISAQNSSSFKIVLMSISGQVIHQEEIRHRAGADNYRISIPEISEGMYLIHCIGQNGHFVKKLYIQP